MVGSSTSGGTPLRRPIAMASASAAVCWNTNMLLRILTTCPQPIGAAMRHVGAHRLEDRPDVGEHRFGGADHDGEFAAGGGLAGAGDGRIGIADPARRQTRADLAGKRHR